MMKQIKILFIILPIFFFGLIQDTNGQCLDFAKTEGFAALDTAIYIPDGRLNSLPLSQGDNLDVYKPFFRGRKYKVVVIAANGISEVNFKVVNFQRKVIFDSQAGGKKVSEWEFESERNQNLIISVELPEAKSSEQPKTGCVAVLVGFSQK